VTRVHFVQTGGFAGLKMTADLDTADLPPDEAIALDQLIDAALAESAELADGSPPPDPRVRDGQQYEVTVVREGDPTLLQASDPHLPPAFRALVTQLLPHANPSR
jgi:hypothetical protein